MTGILDSKNTCNTKQQLSMGAQVHVHSTKAGSGRVCISPCLLWLCNTSKGNMHSLLDMCLCLASVASFLPFALPMHVGGKTAAHLCPCFGAVCEQAAELASCQQHGHVTWPCVHRSRLTAKQQLIPKAARDRMFDVGLMAVSM